MAAALFRPIHDDGVDQLRYGDWLLPFAVSVSFRVLVYWTEVASPPRPVAPEDVAAVARALEVWRVFLLGGEGLTPEQHMFILPHEEVSPFDPGAHVMAYFRGAVDLQAPHPGEDGGLYVISKMCRLCCVGVIRPGKGRPWRYTEVHRGGGALGSPYAIPDWLLLYFRDAMANMSRAVAGLSGKQRQRLLEREMWNVLERTPTH